MASEVRKEVCSSKMQQPRAPPEHSSTPQQPVQTPSSLGRIEMSADSSSTTCHRSQTSLLSLLCNVLTREGRMWPHRHLDVANIRWQKGRPARVLWLGLASSSRQLTKQCGDSINMHRAGKHISIPTYFSWNSAWGSGGPSSQPAEHTPWKAHPQGFRSSWKPWKE